MISNDCARLKWKVPENSENGGLSRVQAAPVIFSELIFVRMDGTLDRELAYKM